MKIEVHRDFGTRACPACAMRCACNENRCPICGYPFPHRPPGRNRIFKITAAVLLMLLLAAVLGLRW